MIGVRVPVSSPNLKSGCIVSLVRRLALDARGRRFESYHPDQIMLSYIVATVNQGGKHHLRGSNPYTQRALSYLLCE